MRACPLKEEEEEEEGREEFIKGTVNIRKNYEAVVVVVVIPCLP